MNWDHVQLGAKAKGQLVFAMDQAQLPIGKVPIIGRLTEGGFCLGLSVTWISEQYDGKDFRHVGQLCEWPPIKAILYHAIATTEGTPEWTDFWDTAGRIERLTLSSGLRGYRRTKPSASYIYSIVTKAYGCYGITMTRSGGAHAIALRHNPSGRMQLFDPNYGHFFVRDHTLLKGFLRWLFKETGYGERYDSGHGVVGIRPPIGPAK